MFDWTFIATHWPQIAEGYRLTLTICAASFVFAWLLGFLIALCRVSRHAVLRAFGTVYVEVVRNVPLAIQVFLIFYTLPFAGIRLSPLWFGVAALSIYIASYYAEIIRAAILSVPRGQYESARSAGMSHLQAMRRVVFPQMMNFLVPPATNVTITLVKESSVLSIITVPELTLAAHTVSAIAFNYLEVFLMVALLYWATTLTLTAIAAWIERLCGRYRVDTSSRPQVGEVVAVR